MDEAQKRNLLKGVAEEIISISEEDLLWIMQKVGCNTQDENGNTLLHLAATAGLERVCHLLLTTGASSDISNNEGRLPAEVALESGHLKLALTLRSNKKTSSTHRAEYIPSSANSFQTKNRGSFSPTTSTRLIDADPDWRIPAELQTDQNWETEAQEKFTSDFGSEIDRFLNIINSLGLEPEQCLLSLYLRASEVTSKIDLINQFGNQAFSVDAFDKIICEIGEVRQSLLSDSASIAVQRDRSFLSQLQRSIPQAIEAIKDVQGILAWIAANVEHAQLKQRGERAATILMKQEAILSQVLEQYTEFFAADDQREFYYFDQALGKVGGFLDELGARSDTVSEAISLLCSLLIGDLTSNPDSEDEDLLRLDVKIDLPQELIERFSQITEDNDRDDDGFDVTELTKWDRRLWSV